MVEEIRWLPVSESGGKYQVSSTGEIRNTITGKVLRQFGRAGGYRLAYLSLQGKGRNRAVHLIVAAAFLGPREDAMDTHHIDGNKENNAAINLSYLSRSSHGSLARPPHTPGELNAQAKLKEWQVREMLSQRGTNGHTHVELARVFARQFNVSERSILNILSGQSWKHLSRDGEARTVVASLRAKLEEARQLAKELKRRNIELQAELVYLRTLVAR